MSSTTQTRISLTRGVEAYTALKDEEFRKKWQALYEQCLWATPFQDYRFVDTWYRIYKDQFEPILLSESASDGGLVGFLPLARCKATGRLIVAGAHQAEYQVWLATPEYGTSFIEKALRELGVLFPGYSLRCMYLPPSAPIDWTGKTSPDGYYCAIETRNTPLLVLKDNQDLTASLRKKSNKSRLNRLKRLGNVEFEEIKTSTDLTSVFDQIIAYYDLRQGALHDSVPFKDDPLKKAFYLALMDSPNFLHVTILKVGKDVAAGHLGLHDKDKAYLGVFAHSPFLAQHSPGKLHLLMLGEKLAKEDYSAFDLTPGGDPWKERFATAHEPVHVVTVYFSYAYMIRHRTHTKMKAVAKSALRRLGVTRGFVTSCLQKLRQPMILFATFVKTIWGRRALRLYTFKCEDVLKIPRLEVLMKKDHIEDLLAFQPFTPLQTRKDFLASCLARLEAGGHVYTFVNKGRLLHYGWLATQEGGTLFPNVEQALNSSPGSAVLYDFYTHPDVGNSGIFRSSLCQMLHDAAALPGAGQVCVAVSVDDSQARWAIKGLGLLPRAV